MNSFRHYLPWCFLLLTALQGCQSVGRVPSITSCSPSHCLETFPSKTIPQKDFWQFDSLAVMPPSIDLEEKSLNNETTRELYIEDDGQGTLIEQLDTMSGSYQLTNIAIKTDLVDKALLLQFEKSIWADSPTVEAILNDIDPHGNPKLVNPALDGPIEIPSALLDAAPESTCCFLVTRITGWHHTGGAIHSKVAFTSLLGSVMGGVGPPVTFGQALSDMVIIRKEDGKVLWSGRALSNGHISQLRATARDYYLQVYESKIEHNK
ncbi:MAG: hypothetical protein ACFE0K_07040 [Alcanivorax sp.]|uniref:hypothetical protein n=1 Tax=Alcanivorax sp. TaxID=1872427 RepID=UPI003DA70015